MTECGHRNRRRYEVVEVDTLGQQILLIVDKCQDCGQVLAVSRGKMNNELYDQTKEGTTDE